MKLDIIKEKKELISIALLGFSVLMAAFILYQIIDFFAVTARAENVVKTAIEQTATEAQNTEQYSAKDLEIARTLTRNNPFALPATSENPVKEVRAIFGNQVLINDRWYGEGDTISGNAKIVAIEPMQVIIEWNGTQTPFRPLDASTPEPQQSDRTTARAGSTGRGAADMVLINGSQTGQMSGRSEMMMNFENLRSRFQNMSDAERERLRNEMRQQFGGGRGGFGGRGGGGGGGFFGGGGGGRGGRGGGRG